MKIRMDFVTNSSSTSFVVIGKWPSLKEFFKLVGVKGKKSPLCDVFESFYNTLKESSEELSGAHKLNDELHTISEPTQERVKKALMEGVPVRVGRLSSSGSAEGEPFLCCEHFTLENEHVFIDLTDSSW